MNKKWLSLMLIALLLAACGQASDIEDIPPAATATPAAGDGATPTPEGVTRGTVILADGQLKSQTPPLALGFKTGGRVLSIDVKPGDRVAAGDVLATLDDEALRDAVVSAEQQVAQAENSLAQAQLSLDNLLNWEPDETAVAVAVIMAVKASDTGQRQIYDVEKREIRAG